MDDLECAITTRRRFLQVAGASSLSAMLFAAGCGGSDAPSGDAAGSPASGQLIDELTFGIVEMPDGLDTTKGSVGSLGTLLLGMEPLVLFTAQQKIEPNLAESFDYPDPTTYRYTIRQGVKFWDGSPLTLDDIVHSFDVHRGETESFLAGQWAGVKSVEKTGPNEITIKLKTPNPQFAYTVATTGIFSKAYHQKNKETIGTPKVLNMGTGPYKFEAFTPSSRTVLVRNDAYWGTKGNVGRLETRVMSDDSTRLLALQSGDVAGLFGIPLSQLDSFKRIPQIKLSSSTDAAIYKFNMETTKAPWDDIHVRRALGHLVDRDAIAKGILGGEAVPAATLPPPAMMEVLMSKEEVDAAYAEIDAMLPEFSVEKAKAELAQSKVPDGFSTTLLVIAADPNLSSIGQLVAQEAKKIGIEIKIKEVDDNTYYNAVYFKHTTEGLSFENFGADGPDPMNIPNNALDSANTLPDGSGVNIAQYKSDRVDGLLAECRRLPPQDTARAPLLIDALKQAAEDLPFMPVAWPKIYMGANGYSFTDFSAFWWASRWPAQLAKA